MMDFSLTRLRPATWHRRKVAVVLAGAALVACMAVGLVFQGGLRSSGGRVQVSSDVAGRQARQTWSAVTTWTFTGGVPSGWSVLAKAISTPSGLLVGTTKTGYQLVAPAVSVGPGEYRLSVTLQLLSGGVGLGVLDATGRHFLVNRPVRTLDVGPQTVTEPFSVRAPGNLFAVLSNVTQGIRSGWMLIAVSVQRNTSGS
jgi:hypothetical protein